MQSNFWTGLKNLDGHKTFWELGHVKGQGISGSLDSFLLFLKTKLTYHILLRTEKNQTFTSKRKLTFTYLPSTRTFMKVVVNIFNTSPNFCVMASTLWTQGLPLQTSAKEVLSSRYFPFSYDLTEFRRNYIRRFFFVRSCSVTATKSKVN